MEEGAPDGDFAGQGGILGALVNREMKTYTAPMSTPLSPIQHPPGDRPTTPCDTPRMGRAPPLVPRGLEASSALRDWGLRKSPRGRPSSLR